MSSDVRKGASKQVGNTRAAGKKSRGRRGDVPQGKGQTACMARKKKGAGTAAHAEQRELKPLFFLVVRHILNKKISGGGGIWYGQYLIFREYKKRFLRNISCMYCPCVTSVAVCPCNHPSNRSGIAAAFFFAAIFPGASRKENCHEKSVENAAGKTGSIFL